MRSIFGGACGLLFAFLLSASLDISTVRAVQNIDGVWSALDAAASAPDARREYAAVYDRVHKRYVMFAGFTNQQGGGYFLFNEVWMLSLDDTPVWEAVEISGTVPGERHSPQWGYDPARNRLIIFGGYGRHLPGMPYEYLNDVWELKLTGNPQWSELAPSGTPPAGRLAGTAVFDVLNQRFVGFGGTAGLPIDTWQLDLKGQPVWSTVATEGVEPPGSYGMTSIFDASRNRMIIFGGSTSAGYFGVHNHTWELDLKPDTPQWRQLNPAGTLPVARRSLTSVYDARRDRMVIFGGWDGLSNDPSSFLNDTWALSFSTEDGEWTQLSPDGSVPGGRDVMAASYDPHGDRMVLFGGWSGTTMLEDTQFLTWDDAGENATATSSAENDGGVASIAWGTQNTTSPIAAVYRREPGTEWTSLGVVEADGAGLVSFQDNSITPGQNYGYQIVVSSEAGDELIGEVWLSSPTGVGDRTPSAGLKLQAWPNPAVGPVSVSLTLTGDSPARLEMFDVRGQRVLSREVGAVGAGAHRLDLGHAKDYPSGVYFLRLTQSGRSVESRFVLVR